jgi:methyl-accepting chemotaxis protein
MRYLAGLGTVLNVATAQRRQAKFYGVLAASSVLILSLVAFSPGAALPATLAMAGVAGLLLRAAAPGEPPQTEHTEIGEAAEQFADDLRAEAEETRRRQAMQGMADALEVHLSALVSQVGGRAQEMRGIADAVAAIAEKSGENIVVTRTAAEDSVEAARSLSVTTAQLERSIASISAQMAEANSVAAGAVAVGVETRHAMSQLTGQLGLVRSVTERIAGLAKQTNLLALNATIEAARAGAAGSGFAVVASEVKALARQTADLTQEIGQIIAAVGGVNLAAVEKVDQMEQRIVHIENIAAAIAREVEEQRKTTAAIASSVQQTAGAADQLSARVDSLTESMMENLDQTAMVHVAASAMVTDADEMEASLRRTITKAVRDAVPESDRRRSPRYAVSESLQHALNCRLEIAGQPLPFRLLDLSDAGCRLTAPDLPPNAAGGSLFMSGLEKPLALKFVSRHMNGDVEMVGVQFISQSIDAARLTGAEQMAA